MEGLVGIIFLVIVGIVSMIKKYQEERELQRRRSERRARPEDLPEATRRILYGTPAAEPAAQRPAHRAGPPSVLTAEPAQQRSEPPVSEPTAREAAPAPRRTPPPLARRGPAEAPKPQEVQRWPLPGRGQEPVERPFEMPTFRAEPPPPPRPRPQPKPPQPTRPTREERLRQRMLEELRAREQAARRRPAPVSRRELRDDLDSPEELRRILVLREVLGPPKAFEEWPGQL